MPTAQALVETRLPQPEITHPLNSTVLTRSRGSLNQHLWARPASPRLAQAWCLSMAAGLEAPTRLQQIVHLEGPKACSGSLPSSPLQTTSPRRQLTHVTQVSVQQASFNRGPSLQSLSSQAVSSSSPDPRASSRCRRKKLPRQLLKAPQSCASPPWRSQRIPCLNRSHSSRDASLYLSVAPLHREKDRSRRCKHRSLKCGKAWPT